MPCEGPGVGWGTRVLGAATSVPHAPPCPDPYTLSLTRAGSFFNVESGDENKSQPDNESSNQAVSEQQGQSNSASKGADKLKESQ